MMMFLIKASIVLSILLGFYNFFLQRESFFAINRAYLMIGLLLTFVLPFVTLPELINHQGIVHKVVSETEMTTINEPSLEVGSELSHAVPNSEIKESSDEIIPSDANSNRGVTYWIGLLYFFGVAILSLNFLTQLLGIFIKINKSNDRLIDDRCIILNQTDETEPCSFFNYVFVSPSKYDKSAYSQILEHEKIHAKKYHSLDLLLSELAIIVLWFNPLVWLFRKEVEKNIEYQTDAVLLGTQAVEAENYQLNLLKIASERKSLNLVSNLPSGQAGYNRSLIKKRIIMMNTEKSNRLSYWKYAFLAPTLFATLLLLNQPLTLNAQENSSLDLNEEEGNGNFYEGEHNNGHSEDLTPFLRAAADGNEEAVKTLIDEGADVNEFLHGEGTALYLALQHSNHEVAKLLLEESADPNLGSRSDGYPIMMAIAAGDIDLVRLLIEKGADVNRELPVDGSALIYACKYGNLPIVQLLVDAGADIDMSVKGDGNPLIMASKGGHLKIVEYFVKKGVDVNYEVVGDEVPLINASEQGHLEVVKYLIANGADVNKVCKEKIQDGSIRIRTALKMAKKKGHDAVVKYLLEKGAKE